MRDKLYPSRIGAPGSLNFDTLNGRAVPAFDHIILSTTDKLHYYAGVAEYKAPTGVTTGAAPRQYSIVNKQCDRLDNGAITLDTTFSDVAMGMEIADTGGFIGTATGVAATTLTDTSQNWPTSASGFTGFVGRTLRMGGLHATITSHTATVHTFTAGWFDAAGVAASTPTAGSYTIDSSGTPNLVVGFGSSVTPRIAYRDLTTDAGTPWTESTAAQYAQFWLITRAGPDFYAMTDAGVTVIGEWRISKCPAGNDIRLASSWGNGLEVGGPEWGITGLTAIGDAPVVGKPDGLWYYDSQTRRFENALRHLEIVPHALNGKMTEAVTGGVVYTTHDGHAYFFDGTSVTEVSPNKFWPVLSRDIGNSRITAIADNGETIAMVTETAYQTTQNANIIVNKVVAGTATAIGANGIDGSMATGMAVGGLVSGSFIDVWADIPFVGVIMHVTRNQNSVAAAVFSALAYASANNTFTAFAGLKDGTRLSAGGSLSYVAFPPSASAGALIPTAIDAGALIQKVDFTYSGAANITQKYGMRITMTGGTFTAGTEIDEIEIIPARTGMPNGGIYSSSTNFSAWDREGLLTHVYLVKRTHTTGFTPHDVYAVNAFPGVWKMAWHTGRLGQAGGLQNLGQSLILWGRYSCIGIMESPTRSPVRTRFPITCKVSTTKPGPLLQIAYDWSGQREEEWPRSKQITGIKIDTRFLQPADTTELFIQHDERDIISLGTFKGGPIIFKPGNISPFRYMNLWLGFSDNATTDANAAQFLEPILIDYDVLDDAEAQDVATATPEST